METLLLNKDDVELLKKIILRLYNIVDGRVVRNELYFMDDKLKDLLTQLKEK